MGIGMVLVLSPEAANEACSACPELLTIGHIQAGDGVVVL
jgi:phosphoribosylaminoimidazole (AIR) synthetase